MRNLSNGINDTHHLFTTSIADQSGDRAGGDSREDSCEREGESDDTEIK